MKILLALFAVTTSLLFSQNCLSSSPAKPLFQGGNGLSVQFPSTGNSSILSAIGSDNDFPAMAVSYDGLFLCALQGPAASADSLYIYNIYQIPITPVPTSPLTTVSLPFPVTTLSNYSIAITPSTPSQFVLIATSNGLVAVSLVNFTTHQLLAEGQSNPITDMSCVSITGDGNYALVGLTNGTVLIYNISSLNQASPSTITCPTYPVHSSFISTPPNEIFGIVNLGKLAYGLQSSPGAIFPINISDPTNAQFNAPYLQAGTLKGMAVNGSGGLGYALYSDLPSIQILGLQAGGISNFFTIPFSSDLISPISIALDANGADLYALCDNDSILHFCANNLILTPTTIVTNIMTPPLCLAIQPPPEEVAQVFKTTR